MATIAALLHDTGLASAGDAGFAMVSIFGCHGINSFHDSSNITSMANAIVGHSVFHSLTNIEDRHDSLDIHQLVPGLQIYVEHSAKVIYLFLDAPSSTESLVGACQQSNKPMDALISEKQSGHMRNLLLILLVSHLVIPIIPAVIPMELISALSILSQAKHGISAHLIQFQAACWKYFDIQPPGPGLEDKRAPGDKRYRDRWASGTLGWGPLRSVPLVAFVAANVPFSAESVENRTVLSRAIKQTQDALQGKIRNLFRQMRFSPMDDHGYNSPTDTRIERSLLSLPASHQPFVHIVPDGALPSRTHKTTTFDEPSLSSWHTNHELSESTDTNITSGRLQTGSSTSRLEVHGDKLLRNFASQWLKSAIKNAQGQAAPSSHRRLDPKQTAVYLPNAEQIACTLLTLRSVLFSEPKYAEFYKPAIPQSPGIKGMVQQIEVILRKKIRDTVDIKRVFSKSHSINVMHTCIDAYRQESPPYYTQQYHRWKLEKALQMYKSMARGPCATNYATQLERECDLIWRKGRQSCEEISLTGKVCRLKSGHDHGAPEPTRTTREERLVSDRHNSGYSFYHACSCGITQKALEDPFDVFDANIGFYLKFGCCIEHGHRVFNIESSHLKDGDLGPDWQVTELPPTDSVLLSLGPASAYRSNAGLEKYDGFIHGTNYLLPWVLATATDMLPNDKMNKSDATENKRTQQEDWPELGAAQTAPKASSRQIPPPAPSMEAFPALGSARPTETSSAAPSSVDQALVKPNEETKKEKRRRDGRRYKDREHRREGQIRGYLGAEYECPLGHRFLSCGGGRVCKLGHKDHPKEHGNHFGKQDIPIFIYCPCSASSMGGQKTTAQLQRFYFVIPDGQMTVQIKPVVKIKSGTKTNTLDFGYANPVTLPADGVYVLRLPFIYSDEVGEPIMPDTHPERRVANSGYVAKGSFSVQMNKPA